MTNFINNHALLIWAIGGFLLLLPFLKGGNMWQKIQDFILWIGLHGMKFGYLIAIGITTHSVVVNNGLTGPRGLKVIWFALILMGLSRIVDRYVTK